MVQKQTKLNPFEVLNIGRGEGTSVLDLIKNFEQASGVSIKYEYATRREGDLPAFWADASLALKLLGWRSKLTVEQMCIDAWRWQLHDPNGLL